MDLRQIENIIAIEQEQNISRAAEKLFLTQSALNQQLLRLERELGAPLFERRKHSMIPTLAGRIYLNTARQMLSMKQDTYRIIHDISEEKTGEISVAFTPEMGAMLFSNIYPVFHETYPDITFRIREVRGKKMDQLLLQREVTFAFTTYYENHKNSELDYIDMASEQMVLGLPSSHPLAHLAGDRSYRTLPLLDLRLLKKDKFVLLSKETKMRDMIDSAFAYAEFRPDVLFESTTTRTAFNMVTQQIAPAFFPQSYVDPKAPMVYFSVAPQSTWMRSVAFLKGCYLTKPEKHFIGLGIDYMNGILR